jgi:hypothetical protein
LAKLITGAIHEAATLGFLIAFFLFINALIGKQIFSNELNDEEGERNLLQFMTF